MFVHLGDFSSRNASKRSVHKYKSVRKYQSQNAEIKLRLNGYLLLITMISRTGSKMLLDEDSISFDDLLRDLVLGLAALRS